MKQERYDSLDLAKLILSFMVLMGHIPPPLSFQEVLLAICRLTIPLFFTISGFLFFRKWPPVTAGSEERKKRLLHFLKRSARLYFSWMILLMPITVKYWSWYGYSLQKSVLLFIMNIFLGETFVNSWFLPALMLGIAIIAVLSSRLSNRSLFIIALACYLVCCAFSSYGNLLQLPQPGSGEFNVKNSFLFSMVWLVIGKVISENEETVLQKTRSHYLPLILIGIAAAVLYGIEYSTCVTRSWASTTDQFVTEIPISTILFLLILSVKMRIPHAKDIRTISTVTYCAHGSFGVVLRSVGKRFGIYFDIPSQWFLSYGLTLLFCVFLGLAIPRLSRYKHLHFLSWLC